MKTPDFEQFMAKIKSMEKGEKLDLSSDEDLSIAVMNLIAIEEHFFFTYSKTGKDKYLDLLDQVREIRKKALKRIIKEYEGEVWCLPPSVEIFTNPRPKKISEIKKGDKVLSADGNFYPVIKLLEKDYYGEMILIKPYYSNDLFSTPDHLFLTTSAIRKKQNHSWRKDEIVFDYLWKEAKELNENDFLVFPRYKKVINKQLINWKYQWENKGCFKPTKFIGRLKIKVDSDLIKLIGVYLSEGSVSERSYYHRNIKKHSYNLYFSFGKHEKEFIKETQRLFYKVFQEEIKIQETHTSIDLICSKRVIVDFFSQFGRNSSEKQLPFWVIDLPKNKLIFLFWGLIKGDGNESKFALTFTTTSAQLAYQLRLILFKIGILHSLKKKLSLSISKIGERVIRGKNPLFTISIAGDGGRVFKEKLGLKYQGKKTSGNFGYVTKDMVLLPLRKIEKVSYRGKVYNLEVAKQENYATFTGIVHNCISKHLLATSMRMMEVGTKALTKKDKKTAKEMFDNAYQLYSLFWGLNLGLTKIEDVERNDNEINLIDEEKKPRLQKKVNLLAKLGEVIKKAVDCCRE